MKRTLFLTSVVTSLAAGLVGAGCQDSFKSCENTATCPPEGDGDGDTGTGGGDGDGDVGDGDGDVGGGGQGGESGGTGGVQVDPCTLCADDEVCNDERECVECFDSEDHCGDATPVCDVEGGGVCVGCLAATDCEDAAFPMCDLEDKVCVTGCESNEDCERFDPEAPVCDTGSGECVQCLSRTDCDGDVCERATNSCVDGRVAGEVGVCEECEYDDDCVVGQLCVGQLFPRNGGAVVGNFCTWIKEAHVGAGTCSEDGKPYAGLGSSVASVEGQVADLCVLATTTCVAFAQHRQAVDGCDVPADDDDACGVAGIDDGRCRENDENVPYCTYPCGNDEDCVGTYSCTGPLGDRYCSLM